jgi:hypothetical protein
MGCMSQKWNEVLAIFEWFKRGNRLHSFDDYDIRKSKRKLGNIKSSFQSDMTGTLKLILKRELDRGGIKIGFSDVTVYFY